MPKSEIVITAQPGADLAALKQEVAQIALPGGMGVVLMIFPLIFFLVAAAIIFISMSKNVEIQRGQIGNMKALGLRRATITFHFLSYTWFTCLLGCAAGALLGVLVFMPLIQMIFPTFYTMPSLRPLGYMQNILVSIALAFLFGTAATVFSVRKPLRESPATAMRPKVPRKTKAIFLEKNERLWAKLPYGQKIVLRNLFLNRARALLSSIGIIGCVGLMLSAFSFINLASFSLPAARAFPVAASAASRSDSTKLISWPQPT